MLDSRGGEVSSYRRDGAARRPWTLRSGCGTWGLSSTSRRSAKTRSVPTRSRAWTAEDLKDLGVSLVGDRRRLSAAIAALKAMPAAEAAARDAGSAAAREAERRQVTVMFCDLVGSTALASRLDPEDVREILAAYCRCCADLIMKGGGFVARYMGDGVLAYFGFPHAHEDDPEQAVRAGFALIDAVGALPAPQPLQVRIGIATGLVVVGDVIGTGSAQEQAVVGETPNLAARLQALAEPNAIVIADSTRRQIAARFEVADLGPQSMKGLAEPQRAWRVLSENRALGRFEALRSGATPLVGRDEEMELLLRRWAQAKAGSGRTVLISAEPGVGKSRIAEALAERIATEPHIRLRYFCSRHDQDSALHPVIAQLERAAAFAREDVPETKLAKLEAMLAQSDATEEETALIAELLSLSTGERYRLPEMSAPQRKERTLQALQVRDLLELTLLGDVQDVVAAVVQVAPIMRSEAERLGTGLRIRSRYSSASRAWGGVCGSESARLLREAGPGIPERHQYGTGPPDPPVGAIVPFAALPHGEQTGRFRPTPVIPSCKATRPR